MMGSSQILWVVIVSVIIAISVSCVHGWGKEGHIATCKLAERNHRIFMKNENPLSLQPAGGYPTDRRQPLLSEEAKKAVKDLLPEYAKDDLPSLCPWADYMRFPYYWSRALHFIDVPDDKCDYNSKRDCQDDHHRKGRCLHGAILNYTSQLRTYGYKHCAHSYNLTEALLFLSHFVGDIHQPLHCGHISDGGGNKIHLHWFRRKSNLHHVWDTLMIESAMKDFYARDLDVMIQAIQLNITGSWTNEVSEWEKCSMKDPPCPVRYANESVHLACKWAYKDVTEDITLGDDYYLSRLPILEKQLARGGVRLAAILNDIFVSTNTSSLVSTE